MDVRLAALESVDPIGVDIRRQANSSAGPLRVARGPRGLIPTIPKPLSTMKLIGWQPNFIISLPDEEPDLAPSVGPTIG